MDNEEERGKPDSFLLFFIGLFTVQREKKGVHDLLFQNNKIVPRSSHIFRTYRLFYYFRNWISAMLYWLVSYHGSRARVENRWGTPFEIWRRYHRTPWIICQPLNQLLLRNAKKRLLYFFHISFSFINLIFF